MVRVRFAPSPTGYLHVGGARTALFNWLYARHTGGAFVLRIEDTDRERSTDASIEQIFESLRWLGLDWDEYYRQTDRTGVHLEVAEGLIEKGLAYEHEGAWWFRVPLEGQTVVHDDLLGDVAYPNDQLKDFVIRRSDGSFLYNFVVVVDDADMGITHVIRGDEHLNNAPKQILLYRALERPAPRFLHVPLILGADRSRLSKRHGDTSVLEYRDRGLLPEALINFIVRLGWSHGDREVFTRDELVELFTLEGINKSAAVFEDTKLRWLNQQHLKQADLDRLVDLVEPFALARGAVTPEMWTGYDRGRLRIGVDLLRDRSHTLEDLAWAMEMLFEVPLAAQDQIEITDAQAVLVMAVAEALAGLSPFSPDQIEETVRATLAERGAKLKEVALPCRIAVTGRKAGPSLFEILSPIGASLVVDRLRTFAEREVH